MSGILFTMRDALRIVRAAVDDHNITEPLSLHMAIVAYCETAIARYLGFDARSFWAYKVSSVENDAVPGVPSDRLVYWRQIYREPKDGSLGDKIKNWVKRLVENVVSDIASRLLVDVFDVLVAELVDLLPGSTEGRLIAIGVGCIAAVTALASDSSVSGPVIEALKSELMMSEGTITINDLAASVGAIEDKLDQILPRITRLEDQVNYLTRRIDPASEEDIP